MNKEEMKQLILDKALSDLQWADNNLAYADCAVDGMIKKLNKMKSKQLKELLKQED